MADTKKKNNSNTKNGTKKTQPASSGKRSTNVNKTEDAKIRENTFLTQAMPYIMALLSVLLAVSVIIGDGKVGGGIKGVLTGLFAGAAYALPIALIVRTVLWKRDASEGLTTSRTVCLAIVFLLIAAFLHIIGGGANELSVAKFYKDGTLLVGGGVIGGFIGELLLRGFGKVCTVIIIIFSAVFLSLYVAGITPRGVVIYIMYKIKTSGEKRKEKRAVREEKRKTAPVSKNKIREEEYLEYLREKKRRAREAENAGTQTTETKKESHDPQIHIQAEPTVYKVKKRRLVDLDIPVDDPISVKEAHAESQKADKVDKFAEDREDSVFIDSEDDNSELVRETLEDNSVDRGAVDEKIFDEVMKRTRERIEKSRLAEGLRDGEKYTVGKAEISASGGDFEETEYPEEYESIDAGEVLDAVEMAALGVRAAKPKTAEEETDSVKLAFSDSEEEDFDVTKIFVNPEDAELLDKLSAAYSAPLDVKRETLSSPLPTVVKPPRPTEPEYKFPPIELLTEDPGNANTNIKEELQDNALKLVDTLKSFNVHTKIENISRGPTITRYELKPEPGTKVRSIVNLVDDIALNLATSGVRIEAPIPGKSAVGIEVPNKNQNTVHLRTLICDDRFVNAKGKLTACLGEDVAGESVYFDVTKMPHLLIAGATGMGKSVCINSLITSLLYKASPSDLKMILVDPKKVELSIYNGIPHLLVPVVSDPKKAAGSLSWAVGEMERRFGLIEAVGVRDIKMYNETVKNDPDYEIMPRIVIIIDELADLMMTAPDDVEESICRLAQKARAAGMHLIIGTQRPSVDVITGLIKANIPSRIAFTVSSQIDSRTIIDRGGAENLIGKGDMLFNPVGAQKPIRVQGAYVSEEDVEEVVAYIKNMNSASSGYNEQVQNEIEREAQRCGVGSKKGAAAAVNEDGDEDDPMLRSAIELAIDSGKISTSLIQRRLSLGYGRAAKLIDRMEQLGYVSAPDGQKPREVLISKQEYMEMRLKDEAPFDV